jgi:hypothetical protein
MKQIFTYLIIFLFFSCNNDKKKNLNYPEINKIQKQVSQPKIVITTETKIETEPKIEYQPIFLNLSPRMGLSEFNNKLRSNPNLHYGKFILSLNDEKCKFNILKKENKIVLSGEFDDSKYIKSLKKTKEYNLYQNEKIILELIEIFKNKYGNFASILPFKKNNKSEYLNAFPKKLSNFFSLSLKKVDNRKTLVDYGFKKDRYLVFQDSIKTILVGFTNRIPTKQFTNFEDAKLQNEQNLGNSFSEKLSDEEYFKYINQPNKIPDFEISINYYHNSDFEIILNKIKKDKYEFDKAKYKHDSIKKANKLKIERNQNNI